MQIDDNSFTPIISILPVESHTILAGNNKIKVTLPPLRLNTGKYSLMIALVGFDSNTCYFRKQNCSTFYSKNRQVEWANIVLKPLSTEVVP